MGRVGSAADNAEMDNSSACCKRNVFNRKTWATRTELSAAVTLWVKRTYHRKRCQRVLDKLTPVEYESIMGKSEFSDYKILWRKNLSTKPTADP